MSANRGTSSKPARCIRHRRRFADFPARGRGRAPPLRTTRYAFVGAGGCPPSCQPIPGHCRVRQSGHFLETGSLHLPLAALRRFPRRPELGLYRISCNVSLRGRAAPVAIRPQSLPCLKGGGPAAGWWRDSCGEESPSHGFAVPAPFRQGGHQPLRRFAHLPLHRGGFLFPCSAYPRQFAKG